MCFLSARLVCTNEHEKVLSTSLLLPWSVLLPDTDQLGDSRILLWLKLFDAELILECCVPVLTSFFQLLYWLVLSYELHCLVHPFGQLRQTPSHQRLRLPRRWAREHQQKGNLCHHTLHQLDHGLPGANHCELAVVQAEFRWERHCWMGEVRVILHV